MTVLPNGIAHVSFCRGATFLPARSPYDCETLIDHVTHAVRTQGRAQVLVHDQTWQVHLVTNFDSPATCSRCCQRLEAICHCSGETTATLLCPVRLRLARATDRVSANAGAEE